MKVWMDGRIVEGPEARVPVTDHGFLYGDGVFEGIRVRGRRILRLDRHLKRLETGARAIGLEIPGGVAAVHRIVASTVKAFDREEAYVRLVVSRGDGPLGVDPTACKEPRIVCIVDTIRLYAPEKLAAGIALATVSWRRPGPDVLDPRVKSLNYLNNALAKLEARRGGADEALLLNGRGTVAEASVANVFALHGAVLSTPPLGDGALEGITRGALLDLAPGLGLSPEERTLGRFDLLSADEVLLSGSGAGVVPVSSLDGSPIGTGRPGPWGPRLLAALERLAQEEGVAV